MFLGPGSCLHLLRTLCTEVLVVCTSTSICVGVGGWVGGGLVCLKSGSVSAGRQAGRKEGRRVLAGEHGRRRRERTNERTNECMHHRQLVLGSLVAW